MGNFIANHLVKFENRSTSTKVIIKHQTASFFGTRYSPLWYL